MSRPNLLLPPDKQPRKRHSLLALTGLLFVCCSLTSYATLLATDPVRLAAFERGYEYGLNDSSWKEKALKDPSYSRRLCSAWWFDSTSLERKLK